MEKKEKSVSEELDDMRKVKSSTFRSSGNELAQFFIGLILLAVGLFLLSKRVVVRSSWHIWSIGNFDISSGLVIVPLIIGIIWQFYNPDSKIPKVIITLGIIFIVVTIIMSVSIHFVSTSMFDYILIIGMAAAGSGLLLKTVFKKRE